jgi:hypothetical protein
MFQKPPSLKRGRTTIPREWDSPVRLLTAIVRATNCKRGNPKAAPLASRKRSAAYYFFALHFWTDVELLVEPSAKISVAMCVHFFFLHRAMT